MYSRFSAAVRFSAPPLETRFRGPACRPCVRVPRSSLRTPEKVGRAGILVEGPGLKLLDPDSNQVARMSSRSARLWNLARNEVLGDLSLNSMLWVRCLAMAFILESPAAPSFLT